MKQERVQSKQQKHKPQRTSAGSPRGERDHWGLPGEQRIPGQHQTPIQDGHQGRDVGNEGTGQGDNVGNVQRADQARNAESRDGNRMDREQQAQPRRQPTEAEQTREDIQRAEEEGMLKHKPENEPRHKASSSQAKDQTRDRGRDKAASTSERPARTQDRHSSKLKQGKSLHRH